jgi:hypothetical protein
MNKTTVKSFDPSKKKQNALSMGMIEKGNVTYVHNLPEQFQSLTSANLQEINYRSRNFNIFGIKTSRVDLSCKYYDPYPQRAEYRTEKKEKLNSNNLFLFVIKKIIAVLFGIIATHYKKILLLIFFLVLAVYL